MEIGIRHAFPLAIALLLLGASISFAYRPAERKLEVLRPLSLSLIFAVLGITLAGFANLLQALRYASFPEAKDSITLLLNGLTEGLAQAIVGFAVLAVAWGLVALGLRRQGG